MKENTKNEQHLNEGQLQAITGGCLLCETDKLHIQQYNQQATQANQKADTLAKQGLHNEEKQKRAEAKDFRGVADQVEMQLSIREGKHLLELQRKIYSSP
jgi:hypothetical protein